VTSSASGAFSAADLPGCAPIPRSALGPALNDQGYDVGRGERSLYWVTDGVYQSAFLATRDGVVRFDVPPSVGPAIAKHVRASHQSRRRIAKDQFFQRLVPTALSPTRVTARDHYAQEG